MMDTIVLTPEEWEAFHRQLEEPIDPERLARMQASFDRGSKLLAEMKQHGFARLQPR